MKKLLLISFTLLMSWTAYSQCIISDTVITNATCYGMCNGSISITVTGGDGMYNYSWSHGSFNSNVVDYLCEGSYTVTAFDQSGCSVTETYVVGEPAMATVDYTLTDESCPQACDGTAQLTVTGATPPYTTSWFGNGPGIDQGNLLFTDICASNYYGYVYDSLDCSIYVDFNINSPTSMVFNLNVNNKDCSGNNGSIEVMWDMGDGPFIYNWSNGANSILNSGLDLGRYDVTITDSHSCTKEDFAMVSSNGSLYGSLYQDSIIHCNGDNNATLNASAMGMPPFNFYWSDGYEELGIANYNSIRSFLSPGIYMVTITDGNSGQGSCATLVWLEVTEPDPIVVNYEMYEPYCYGQPSGSINTSPIGGTINLGSYTYAWSHNISEIWGSVSGLPAGSYTVTVSDENGCSATQTIDLMQPDSLMLDSAYVNNGCFGMNNGTIVLNYIGGTEPYYFSTDSMSWEENNTFFDLAEGSYTYYIKDNNYCFTPHITINITEPPVLVSTVTSTPEECSTPATGTADATITGGTPPYIFNWSNTGTTEDITNLTAGIYYLDVVDANNCTIQDSVTVTQLGLSTLSGTVLLNSVPLNAGDAQIELFEETTGVYGLAQINTSPNAAGGIFTFANIPSGNFTLKATPSGTLNAFNTWYIDTINWEGAQMIAFGCEDTITGLQFELKEIPNTTGQGSISGFIYFWNPAKGFMEVGEPVIGAEVFIEQEPNDEPIAQGSTTSTGSYYFGNLAEGEAYSIHVDIPGLPTLSSYENLPVTAVINEYVNMNYFIDTTETYGGVFIDTALSVNFNEAKTSFLLVYPNPVITQAHIEFKIDKTSNYSWALYDESGRLINKSDIILLNEGKHTITIPIQEEGVYYLINTFNNNKFVKKLIKE